MEVFIAYICDRKDECGGCEHCHKGEDGCSRTTNPEHAKYGSCEGDPSWYPERFYQVDEDRWFERERY